MLNSLPETIVRVAIIRLTKIQGLIERGDYKAATDEFQAVDDAVTTLWCLQDGLDDA